MANCKYKFNGRGRLFEPTNFSSDKKVVSSARKTNGDEPYWIGIRTQVHNPSHQNYDFYYASKDTNTPLKYDGWDASAGEPNNLGFNEDCVSVLNHGNLQWGDDECAISHLSICELNEDEGKGTFKN